VGRLAPYLCHRLAISLVAPILLYRVDLLTPNVDSLTRLNTFWHKVPRWATNCFSSTPIGIMAIESCLPPIPLLVSQRQRLAALRTVFSLSSVNPVTAGLHASFPSLSSYRAPDGSRFLTKGLSSVNLLLSWKTPRPSPPFRTHWHLLIDAVAHKTITFAGGLSRMPMINAHLVPEVSSNLTRQSLMENTSSAVKKRIREALIEDWSRLFPPYLLSPPPSPSSTPLYGLGLVHGRANPPNKSWEKLPAGTALLEGPWGRYLLPPLRFVTRIFRTRHPHMSF